MSKILVIGSGFAGLSAATCLAHAGHDVTILEKNNQPGGRARQLIDQGFTFDIGPSFYWMPDVFEKYFGLFGKKVSDYYQLTRLDPSYRICFGPGDYMDVPANMDDLRAMFEKLEPGSGKELDRFMKEGEYKYNIGINDLVYKPGLSLFEFADTRLLAGLTKMHVFTSISSYVRKFFRNKKIIQLLEFPVLFLGATPSNTPALYSLMNYADMSLGTWYPEGGMYSVVNGMVKLAKEKGVQFQLGTEVSGIDVVNGKVTGVTTASGQYHADAVVASADYHHVEQKLLPESYRRYSPAYWERRTMAPSALLYYVGVNKKLKDLQHHVLFFDRDFTKHAEAIYEKPAWPEDPQFYVSCTSLTDKTVAPEGHENLVILIPVAPGLKDTDEVREKYFEAVMTRLENLTGQSIRPHVVFKKSYAHRDFISDYHAFRGNAYGLANTLLQTANLKPSILNKRLPNLFYTGQLTVPGPGVPPSIISGQVVAKVVSERLKK